MGRPPLDYVDEYAQQLADDQRAVVAEVVAVHGLAESADHSGSSST